MGKTKAVAKKPAKAKGKAKVDGNSTGKPDGKSAARPDGKSAARPAGKPAVKLPPKLPQVALKPKHPTAPSLPLPPAPPQPEPSRDELIAPRDIGRLLRYGERFGPHKIDTRMLPVQLPVAATRLAICDPAVPKSWRTFDRPVTPGTFRVMLSLAKLSEKGVDKERLAAVIVHVGRPPIAKWTVAHFTGQKKPKTPDQLPRVPSTSGWLVLVDAGSGSPGPIAVGDASGSGPIEIALADGRKALALRCDEGEYAAYWAIDETDRPICLVIDFDVLTQKDWKTKPT
ncbi:MAG: DUF4241 domain-containing protein [Deltaproteobacteria bacterium]|nr:DUF4241 domain-containing protein [Deltaproteobacteria bacterium]MDQ3298763.1 DUF4241 domain-containing protein [Myxococcota bacterium]